MKRSAEVKKAGRTEGSKTQPTDAGRRPHAFRGKVLLFLGSLLVCALLAEVALRILCRDLLSDVEEKGSLGYRYDSELGWFPVPNSSKQVSGSRIFTATHNSKGFRESDQPRTDKPAIIFLGDSLVWGFDVEAAERFTERLQVKHPEWAIHNLGVSGYGTDQEYLLLQKHFEEFQPRFVFLVICGDNDNEDNSWNFRGGYYKPFYTLESGHLQVHGIPVPKSARVFRAGHKTLCRSYLVRMMAQLWSNWTSPKPTKKPEPPTGALLLDMRTYVLSHGARFAVGLQHTNAELEKFLEDFKIPYVDLSTTNASQVYPGFGNHWTPEGHGFVAEKIDTFLSSMPPL